MVYYLSPPTTESYKIKIKKENFANPELQVKMFGVPALFLIIGMAMISWSKSSIFYDSKKDTTGATIYEYKVVPMFIAAVVLVAAGLAVVHFLVPPHDKEDGASSGSSAAPLPAVI